MSGKKGKRKSSSTPPRPSREIAGRPDDVPAVVHQEEIFPSAIHVESSSSFSGPLPPPDLLAEYNQVLPGLAERIVAMTEAEGENRRALQRRVLRLSEAGLVSAFVITMTVIVWGFVLIGQGKSPEGMTSIIAALGSLLIVYLTRRKPK